MSETSQSVPSVEPETETPAAPTENAQRFLELMDELRRSYMDLRQKLTGETLYDAIVAGLSCHPNFISLLRNMVRETMAEIIAADASAHDHNAFQAPADDANVDHYEVVLSDLANEKTLVRATITGSDNPERPNAIEAYSQDNEGAWRFTLLTPKSEQAIRDAFVAQAIPPYQFKWCELTVFTHAPLNEDSRPVETAQESSDGPGED